MDSVDSIPTADPFIVCGLGFGIPLLLLGLYIVFSEYGRSEPHYQRAAAHYVSQHAAKLLILHFILVLAMVANNVLTAYQNLNFPVDIEYFLRVDFPEYDVIQAIDNSVTLYGTDKYTGNLPNRRRLKQREESVLSTQSVRLSGRLQSQSSSSSNEALTLIYHTRDWDDMLTPTLWKAACRAEAAMYSTLPCLVDDSGVPSLVRAVVNSYSSCDPIFSAGAQLTSLLSATASELAEIYLEGLWFVYVYILCP